MQETQKNNEKNRVFKAGIGYTVSNYLIKGLGFLTIPIFSRLLSTNDYGTYNTYQAYEGIVSQIVCLALFMSLKNAKYKYKDKYQDYVSSILLLQIFTTSIWLLVAIMFSNQLSAVMGITRICVVLIVIQSLCSGILTLYNVDASISYSYKSYLKLAATNSILNIGLSIILILTIFNGERYMGRIVGGLIAFVILTIYVYFHYWRISAPHVIKEYWKYGIRYSMPLVPHAISQVLLNQFDRIMINSMVGASEAGIYSFAYNIYTIVSVITGSLDNVWSPWFYEKRNDKQFDKIKKYSAKYAQLILALCVEVLLVSPEIIKILAPKSYWDSIYCVVPIVAAGYFTFLYTIPCQVEYYHAKTGMISIATGIATVVNIVTNYIFIIKFGYVAAAYTTLFTYLLYFIFHYLMAKRIEGDCIFDTHKIIGCCVLMFAASAITLVLINTAIIRWIIAIMFFAIGFITIDRRYGIKLLLSKLRH